MREIFVVDDLAFELRRSASRKTVGITVDRQGELILSAPIGCSLETLEQAVRNKYRWIYSKIAEKELLFRKPAVKEFVSGESFYYLGRSYRLQLVEAQPNEPTLLLEGEWFLLRKDAVKEAEGHFVRWYCKNGQEWLEKRVKLFTNYVGAEPKAIRIRELGYRWGSCTAHETLNFHWRTMLLPPWAIDYVIVHELVHLHEANHDIHFWQKVEAVMPDYRERRQWLEENGSKY